ncbi:MAG: hypothetical protein IT246_04585 [Bacteroidia bacterium]|nr:hypothetical protein [Bacteroidia bacterium]MCZ2248193.1 hypothetical protein [Bacteroidia bacterium]
MNLVKIIFVTIISFTILSCKKNKDLNDSKCFCLEFKNQKCLKYYQTAGQDPWGNWLQPDRVIEKRVGQFCDSLGVQVLKITIKDTKDRSDLRFQCTCSKTGKLICIKVKPSDADKLKPFNFIDI